MPRYDERGITEEDQELLLRVLKLVDALPKSLAGRTIGSQLIRSGTSVGANYRASCKGRSTAEFIAKLGTVEEEADESAFWLELIIEGGLLTKLQVQELLTEAEEITAIIAASRKTAALNKSNRTLAIGNRK